MASSHVCRRIDSQMAARLTLQMVRRLDTDELLELLRSSPALHAKIEVFMGQYVRLVTMGSVSAARQNEPPRPLHTPAACVAARPVPPRRRH
jgi:hypothetical protein